MGLLLFGLMGNAISICLLCLHFLKLICYYLGQWEIFFFQNENSFISPDYIYAYIKFQVIHKAVKKKKKKRNKNQLYLMHSKVTWQSFGYHGPGALLGTGGLCEQDSIYLCAPYILVGKRDTHLKSKLTRQLKQ